MTAISTEPTHSRLDYTTASPQGFQAMIGLERHIRSASLAPRLLHLVKLRASQINGCAYCIDMHSKDALAEGESEQRLLGLSAWQETSYYSEEEQAALAWTEALTLVHQERVSEALFARLRSVFEPSELADLSLAIVTINGWNRLAIAFGARAGSYERAQS